MDVQQAQENGYKVVKTLPPVSFGTGPEWPVPVEMALGFMQSVYDQDPELFGAHMLAAATGTPARPLATGRRRGSGRGPGQVSG